MRIIKARLNIDLAVRWIWDLFSSIIDVHGDRVFLESDRINELENLLSAVQNTQEESIKPSIAFS